MANRYWVTGGTGNWNSTTNWATTSGGASGASVPGSSDAALLDASSGAGTVTLDISPTIQTLTCTGFTGTLAFGTNTISLNSTGTIFTGATTMTVTGTPQIICTNSSATSRTINPGLVSEANAISFRITAGTGTVTFTSANSNVLNLDFTDGTNPTGYAGALANINPTIYGNFNASTGMTKTAGTGTITFGATSGTKTINTAGVTFDNPFNFNGVGGSWQLIDNLTTGSTRTVALINGTLDLNGKTLSTGIFSSSNSNARSIAFGTGNITLTGNNATIWTTSTATNFTYSGTPTVNCTYAGSTGTRTIIGGTRTNGGNESNALNFNISAGSDIFNLSGSSVNNGCTYKTVDFTGFLGYLFGASSLRVVYGNLIISTGMTINSASGEIEFAATSGTQQITTNSKTLDFPLTFNGASGTMAFQDALTQGTTRAFTITNGTVQFKAGTTNTVGAFATSGTNQKYLQSTSAGTQATLSQASGTVNANYLTIQDSKATGGATFNAFTGAGGGSSANNVNSGNNTGWNFIPSGSGFLSFF